MVDGEVCIGLFAVRDVEKVVLSLSILEFVIHECIDDEVNSCLEC